MISSWIQAPERALEPQNRVGERKILRGSIERKPDSAQAVRGRQKIVVRNISVVIPNESVVPCRPVNQNRQHTQAESAQTCEQTRMRKRATHWVRYCLSRVRRQKRCRNFQLFLFADPVRLDREGCIV